MIPSCVAQEDFVYNEPPDERVLLFVKEFDTLLKTFNEKTGIGEEDYCCCLPSIIDIYYRIDQRRDYYLYFHSEEEETALMHEAKEAALLCYWIIKYKPLYQVGEVRDEFHHSEFCSVNEIFALFVLQSFMTERVGRLKRRKVRSFFKEFSHNIKYEFMHRDMTKESIMLYVYSLLETLKR